MARTFPTTPFQIAYERRVLFAARITDPATLARVSSGITVTATGLARAPIVNLGGDFVWLEEGGAQPLRVQVDPGVLPYEREDVAATVPPDRLMSITLRPRNGYAFPDGVTAIRSALYEAIADPPVPKPGETVRLRWLDDNVGPPVWRDAATPTMTNANGDFVAFVRLHPNDVPALDASGRMRLVLSAGPDAGPRRNSMEWTIPQGRTSDLRPFAWSDLQAV